MRILFITVTLLFSILGVISNESSSAGNEVENEELEVDVDDDIFDSESLADMEFDRKRKPGGKSKCPKPIKNYWLVTTGGDTNKTSLDSSEIIGYLGVCNKPHIPNLPKTTTGGQSVWLPSKDTLMFCGGSNEYVYAEPNADNWGATDKCFTLKPGGSWKNNPNNWMKTARGWFSLTRVGKGKVIAAGGHDGDGNALTSMEMYSKGKWEIMDIILPNPLYGHCAVHYKAGSKKRMNSYLMIIGGSSNHTHPILNADGCDPSVICPIGCLPPLCIPPPCCYFPSGYALRINLDTGSIEHVNHWPLPPLWAPACTLVGENIFVSGGASHDASNPETNGVYKYNIKKDVWSHVGNFIYGRWGHVMGTTSRGQMVIAGGYAGTDLHTFNSIEASDNKGITWAVKQPGLKSGGEYMAMAQVPASTFGCNLDPAECRLAICNSKGDCDEACGMCRQYEGFDWPFPPYYFGVCEPFPVQE